MKEVSLNIIVRKEQMGEKGIFIVSNEEIGIADFGDTLDKAIENFKKSACLYLDAYPEKKNILIKEEKPVFISRIVL